jgi:hypothetical protein
MFSWELRGVQAIVCEFARTPLSCIKFRNFKIEDVHELSPSAECSRCKRKFFGARFVRYKCINENFCRDCFFEAEYRKNYINTKADLEALLREHLRAAHKTKCALCGVEVVDSVIHYEFDHVDVGSKSFNVGHGILELLPFEEICREIEYCRLLCDLCHSAVTRVQQASGVSNIPREVLLSNAALQQQITTKVDAASKALIAKSH